MTSASVSVSDFKFIMGAILGQKDDSPLSKCFENSGIADVPSILTLSDAAIDRLKHVDKDFKPPINEPLNVGLQQLLRAFNAFVETRNDDENPIHGDWQNKAKKVDFDNYRLTGFTKYVAKVKVPRALAPTGSQTSGSSSFTRDPVANFKKGIKHDPASFTVASVSDFDFIMTTILRQGTDSPLRKAFLKAGINDIAGVITLRGRDIDGLKFPDVSSGTIVLEKLADGDQQLIHCFIAFFNKKIADGILIYLDWQNLAETTEFQEFQIIGYSSHCNAWHYWCNVSCNERHNASCNAWCNALDNDRDTDRFDLNDDNGITPVVIPRNGIAVVVAADPIPNDPEEGAMDQLDGENTSG